jgi:hypothetical protein
MFRNVTRHDMAVISLLVVQTFFRSTPPPLAPQLRALIRQRDLWYLQMHLDLATAYRLNEPRERQFP